MTLSFSAATHTYQAGDRVLPSVTGILRACGLTGSFEFRDRVHAFRGTVVHEGSAIIIAGGHPVLEPLPPSHAGQPEYVKVHGEIEGYWAAFIARQSQFWDIKSGTYPEMTIVQIAAYEDLARRGLPVNPDHTGLGWLREVLGREEGIERCGLRLEKTGRFTAFYETSKGEPYHLPKWMSAWRSCVALYTLIQDHQYTETTLDGTVLKKSRLSDMGWVAGQIKDSLKGPSYDAAMRAGSNIFNLRQQYGLL